MAANDRLQPGATSIPHTGWNRAMDAADIVLSGGGPTFDPSRGSAGPTAVLVKNTTGANLPRFAVVGLDGFVHEPQNADWKNGPTFKAVTPQIEQHFSDFAVVQTALPKNAIGPAVIHGDTVCKVDIQAEGDFLCGIADDDSSNLVSGVGSALILYPRTGTGVKDAYVRLGGDLTRQRWIPFKNTTAAEIPAYGLVRTAAPSDAAGSILAASNSNWSYRVPVAANGPKAVAAGEYGLFTFDWPCWVRYEADADASWGEVFGEQAAVADQYTLRRLVGSTGTAIDSTESTGGFACLGLRRANPNRALFMFGDRFRTYQFIRFTLAADLTIASVKAAATLKHGWNGSAGATGSIEVYNQPDDENPGSYIFSGVSGNTGLAVAEYLNSTKYWIVWIKCPDSCG